MHLSKLSDAVWRRHANPGSVWTRLLSVPLVFVPLWNRSWSQGLGVAAWMAINPLLFPEPKEENSWAARAIRGERRWVKARPRDASLIIQSNRFCRASWWVLCRGPAPVRADRGVCDRGDGMQCMIPGPYGQHLWSRAGGNRPRGRRASVTAPPYAPHHPRNRRPRRHQPPPQRGWLGGAGPCAAQLLREAEWRCARSRSGAAAVARTTCSS